MHTMQTKNGKITLYNIKTNHNFAGFFGCGLSAVPDLDDDDDDGGDDDDDD